MCLYNKKKKQIQRFEYYLTYFTFCISNNSIAPSVAHVKKYEHTNLRIALQYNEGEHIQDMQ